MFQGKLCLHREGTIRLMSSCSIRGNDVVNGNITRDSERGEIQCKYIVSHFVNDISCESVNRKCTKSTDHPDGRKID